MGLYKILKEGAILVGDHITQPIRAKIHSIRTGNPMYIEKVETHHLLEDLFDLDDKRVTWYLRSKDPQKQSSL